MIDLQYAGCGHFNLLCFGWLNPYDVISCGCKGPDDCHI